MVPSHLSARGGRWCLLATGVAVERPCKEIEARGTRPGLTAVVPSHLSARRTLVHLLAAGAAVTGGAERGKTRRTRAGLATVVAADVAATLRGSWRRRQTRHAAEGKHGNARKVDDEPFYHGPSPPMSPLGERLRRGSY